MKKVVILILALIMVFGIVGCSSAPAPCRRNNKHTTAHRRSNTDTRGNASCNRKSNGRRNIRNN